MLEVEAWLRGVTGGNGWKRLTSAGSGYWPGPGPWRHRTDQLLCPWLMEGVSCRGRIPSPLLLGTAMSGSDLSPSPSPAVLIVCHAQGHPSFMPLMRSIVLAL